MEVIKNLRGLSNLALQNLMTIQVLEGKAGLVDALFPLNLYLPRAAPSKEVVALWPKANESMRLYEDLCISKAAAVAVLRSWLAPDGSVLA